MPPLLLPHGPPSGDFASALGGSPAKARLFPPVITVLIEDWKTMAWRSPSVTCPARPAYVYVWADGINVNTGLDDKLCWW